MLNFFHFKKLNDQYLITNDFGRYAFLNDSEFQALWTKTIDPNSPLATYLQENYFLFQGSPAAFTAQHAYLLRDSKNYVFSATCLHIFVVTTACNMNCIYCQANNGQTKPTDFMNQETARRAVDIALSSPAHTMSFEFQGGEPLLNFPIIRFIVEYTERQKGGKEISYSVVSNLTLLTDEMVRFFAKYKVSISTSLDGNQYLHNKNRPYPTGAGTYQDVLRGIDKLREAGICVGAIETTTRQSLSHLKEIIDTYCDLGFRSIFLRPLTPLGCANKEWTTIGYSTEEFTQFYSDAIAYILEKNRQGYALQEGHAAILFSKILHGYPVNYMELRSPCGAAVGQMAYYANGDVFTCDEGRMLYEMGDDSFRLGNVYQHDYTALVHSTACRAVCLASITESIPSCCDCVYQPYCGVCPVVNLALYRDILPKTSNHYRCGIYQGILDTLFKLLQTCDDKTLKIIESWYA